jgi:hypothetical protein
VLDSIAFTKYTREINLKEERLIWLMISEVSVHVQLALLFKPVVRQKKIGSLWWLKVAYLIS